MKIIDLGTLEFTTTNFVLPELQEYFTDIIFKVKGKKSEQQYYVSILIEHKSYVDKLTFFQIGTYLFNGYINQSKQGQDFHIIIPMIYYNGGKQWNVKNMEDLFGEVPSNLLKYLPSFSYEFFDLFKLTEDEILNLQNGMLASSMLLQKYRFNPDEMIKKFDLIINTLAPFQRGNFLYKFVVYLHSVTEFSSFEFERLITNNNVIPQELKKEIMSTADMLISKGKAEGLAEGKAIEQETIVCNAYKKVNDINFVAEITLITADQVTEILKKNGLLE